MKYLFLIFFLFPHVTEDWKKYEDDKFSINYPSDWNALKNEYVEGNYSWTSPLSDSNDRFSENVNLLIQDLEGWDFTLSQYVEVSTEQINLLPQSSILKNKREVKGKDEFHVMHYTVKRSGLNLYLVQHYRILDKNAWVLTFTSEQEEYAKSSEAGLKILESIRIKE